MRFTNKTRLLLILHWCGANLLMVLGNDFPTIEDIVGQIHINQTVAPMNMTDCKYLNNSLLVDVLCLAPDWIHGVKKDQYPPMTRYLRFVQIWILMVGDAAQ